MEAKRCGAAALAAALALACALPPAAHAAQLVRTYAQGEPVPDELVLDGDEYSLVSWKPGGGLDAATRTFERTAFKTLAAADYGGDPSACFDAEMEIAEEGFSGSIPLVNAKAEASAMHPERSDYEESVEFSYITKAELDALPAKRKATVAGAEVELSKLDVQADRVPSDPGTEIYSGHAVYGIHEQRDVTDEYRLEATYAGELSREASPATVVATYEVRAAALVDAEAGADDPGLAAAREEPQFPQATFPWAACIPAIVALAACAAIVAVCAHAYGRRRDPGDEAEGDDGEEEEGAGPGGAGRPEEEEKHADCQE